MKDEYVGIVLSGDYEKDIDAIKKSGLPKEPSDKNSLPLSEYDRFLEFGEILKKKFGEIKPNKYEKE